MTQRSREDAEAGPQPPDAQLRAVHDRLEELRRQMEGVRSQERASAAAAERRRLDAERVAHFLEIARRGLDAQHVHTRALEHVISRVSVSRGWRWTAWLRALADWLDPVLISESSLIPNAQLRPTGPAGEWDVVGPDPQFVCGCLPVDGPVRIEISATYDTPGRAEMYFDAGGSFEPQYRLDLGQVPVGTLDVSLAHTLPPSTRAIRWDPTDTPGRIHVHKFRVSALPRLAPVGPAVGTAAKRFLAALRPARNRSGRAPATPPPPPQDLPPTPPSAAPLPPRAGDGANAEVPVHSPGTNDKPHPSPARDRLRQIARRQSGVNFYSPLSAPTGLGAAGRGYQRALAATGLPVDPIDVPTWTGREPSDHRPFAPDQTSPAPAEPTPGYRVNVIHQNPDMLPLFVPHFGPGAFEDKYNVGVWVWELAAFRPDWHRYFRAFDEIWAPSRFARDSIASISPVPVVHVPHVVDRLEETAIFDRGHFGLPADAFVFLCAFDISSYVERKNPLVLLDAFARVFGRRTDVLLLLKCHSAGANVPVARALRRAAAETPNVRLLAGVLSDEETRSLHRVTDALVSPHRAEGFGLNIAESMYFGKAVVATGYSGNADFMSPDNSYPVDYDLVQLKENAGPYLAGYVWADPRFDDLCEKMKLAFEDAAGRQARGERARQTIRERFSAEAVARVIRHRLDHLGLTSAADRLDEAPLRRPPRATLALPPRRRGEDYDPLPHRPTISVITPVYNVPAEYLEKCIRSVVAQTYPFWELCLCDDCSTDEQTLAVLDRYRGTDPRIKVIRNEKNLGISGASNRAAEFATGEFIAMLDNDDEIDPDALYHIAKAVNDNPRADLLYTDEDKIEPDGTHTEHFYKPDFSPDHLRSVMYLLHMLVVRKSLFLKVGMFREAFTGAQDYDLALRLSEVTENVVHIPRLLYHWRKIPGSAAAVVNAKPYALLNAQRALEDHLRRTGLGGQVVDGKLAGMFRVRPAIRGTPPVTLVITTDARTVDVPHRGRLDLARNFVRTIREKTAYPNYQILVVDNGNLSEDQRRTLAETHACRIASYPGPRSPFNFAAKANFAFSHVRTEHLVLLNDDMEVTDGDWLAALLELSQLPDVGAVGAKLITPDHRIQHAGIVLGVHNGSAHIYHGHPADTVGYGGFPQLIRNYSAVTGACLATRKSVIAEAGGFDERFAIDYNDTSFCLTLRKLGYRVVYTPYAELYHFESVTAVRSAQNPAEVELFHRLWGDVLANDPYYNPNLSRNRHDFSVDSTPAS